MFIVLSISGNDAFSNKGPKVIYPSKVMVAVLDPVFTWKYSNTPGVYFEIKIAEDADFSKNVIHLRTPMPSLQLSIPYLKKGNTYYWTIRAVYTQNSQLVQTNWAHEDKNDISAFMFTVSSDAYGNLGHSPFIIEPENESKIGTLQPALKWSYPDHSNAGFVIKNMNNEWVSPKLINISYWLQISRSREFSDSYKTFEIKNDSTRLQLTIPYITAGQTYFWRVKAIYTDPEKLVVKESDWSGSAANPKIPAAFSTEANAVGIFGFNEGQKEEMVDPFKIASVVRLTSGLNNSFAPAVSMDGTRLAYCSDKDNQIEIYVKNLNEKYGSGETKKTVSSKGVSNFSPFWLFNNAELGFYSNRYNSESIWELFSSTRGTGTSVTFQTNKLEMEENAERFNLYGSCSSDGKIVFTAKSRNSTLYRLLLKDLKDNSITDLSPGMFPSISNDDRIVFAVDEKQDGNYEIMMVELEGHSLNNPSVIAPHEASDYDPAISPDGSRIIFSSTRSGNSDIWVMSSDGADVRQITFHPMADRRPQWLDNENIVFQSNRIVNNDNNPKWNIYKMAVPRN